MLKPNSRMIFDYVRANKDENISAADIAEATGLGVKSVNGSITAFTKKELMVRVPAEVQLEDGSHKQVKFIKMTDAGLAFDPDAEETKDAE